MKFNDTVVYLRGVYVTILLLQNGIQEGKEWKVQTDTNICIFLLILSLKIFKVMENF